jgi:peptidoglycan/xylan/chitin deacetylase (PgdA/CDA1 family)
MGEHAMTPLIPVLLYHSVNDHAAAEDRPWTVSPESFASHMDVVSTYGRVALTVSQIAAALRGERALPARPVGITFDDGFSDNYDALASLRARGLASTIYITTGEVGRHDRLSPDQLAELADTPSVEIGAHAVRHRRLDELDIGELITEVRDSKSQLEELIHAGVDSFAYPHGAFDRRVREAVAAAGYRSAAAVKNAISHDRDDPFAIARWTVTAGTSAARIAEVLDGKSVDSAWAHDRLRTRAYRMARRGRRRLALTVGRPR